MLRGNCTMSPLEVTNPLLLPTLSSPSLSSNHSCIPSYQPTIDLDALKHRLQSMLAHDESPQSSTNTMPSSTAVHPAFQMTETVFPIIAPPLTLSNISNPCSIAKSLNNHLQ